jgi:DnaJ-domain-containing protein 1
MAPRFSRRRDHADEPTEADADDADLGAAEHAWWAQREAEDLWSPREAPVADPEPERDILAEHFGADWRTSFGFDRPDDVPGPSEPDAAPPEPEIDTSDPYAVLGVEVSATWEEIVDARRNQARRHHPDRLVGRAAAELAAAEDRIRDINVAFQELRVRRGK